ncbi:MAG: neutral/alkaline non-lysosomal ceramidase N-terminal domain-containing protein [Pirellulales bacterium]
MRVSLGLSIQRAFLALACLVAVGGFPGPLLGQELSVGTAQVEITPPRGMRMCGYFFERLNTGTHDPLWAKALVFQQGDVRAALVFCDLIGLPRAVTQRARRDAAIKTGIPADNILVAATHSHTGPLYFDALRDFYHSQAVGHFGQDAAEPVDYSAVLAGKIVAAVEAAHKAAKPATLAAGVAQQRGLSFNRRFHLRDGSVVFNPGKLNPNIVRPAGPIDPDLGLVAVRDAAGQTEAVLAVFALHLDTVGGTDYSADYPFYLERGLQTALGPRVVSLFAAGTCGDINHIDVTHDRPQGGQAEAERIGSALSATATSTLANLPPIANPSLAVRRAIVEAPLQTYPPEQLEAARQRLPEVGRRLMPFLEEVETVKIVDLERLGGQPNYPLETQVFRFSDEVAVVGLPGEVFVELGLAIKAASPFPTTLVIELANDDPAYIPTRKAFAEGSYETVNSRVQSGSGEQLVEAAVRLLKELAVRPDK